MKKLTVHILDVAAGESACGMLLKISKLQNDTFQLCNEQVTAINGRVEPFLLAENDFLSGNYRLQVYLGDYFVSRKYQLSEPRFLDIINIDFGVADESIHLPLLITPWSYSLYRGS